MDLRVAGEERADLMERDAVLHGRRVEGHAVLPRHLARPRHVVVVLRRRCGLRCRLRIEYLGGDRTGRDRTGGDQGRLAQELTTLGHRSDSELG